MVLCMLLFACGVLSAITSSNNIHCIKLLYCKDFWVWQSVLLFKKFCYDQVSVALTSTEFV